jgi:hypothetical protein
VIRRLVDFSSRRRTAVIGAVLAAALIGAWSARRLPCDALPDTGDRQVIVFSRWDRSPDIIEDQVTYPIVTRMMGMPGVKARFPTTASPGCMSFFRMEQIRIGQGPARRNILPARCRACRKASQRNWVRMPTG